VFCGGRVLQLDNFRKLRGFGWPGFSRMRLWRQNKGSAVLAAAFVNAVKHNAPSPVFFERVCQRAGRAASIYYSLVESCKVNKVNPLTYLTYVLSNVRDKHVTLLTSYEFHASGLA
jgi:hypothetical protein